jgi:hypothetical protein
MKKLKDIELEIEEKSNKLKQKGVDPKIILMGSMSYYTLKIGLPKQMIENIDNVGVILKEYKGMRVIQKPSFEAGGIFKAEHESVEVFGD